MITLATLTRADVARALHLVLPADQEPFVGTISEMTADPDPLQDFQVVERDGEVVAFFKVDRDFQRRIEWLPKGCLGLRGLLVGGQFQGQGIGRALFAQLKEYLQISYPEASDIWLSVDEGNKIAIGLYGDNGWIIERQGFAGRSGPELVMRLSLR